MSNTKGSNLVGRRRTLQLFGAGIGATALFATIGACKDNSAGSGGATSGGNAAAPLDCNSPIGEDSKVLRRNLQYKKEATDPAKKCIACAQYEAGKYKDCGGCKLIPGPVAPNGGCLSFAPLEAGAAPAATPG